MNLNIYTAKNIVLIEIVIFVLIKYRRTYIILKKKRKKEKKNPIFLAVETIFVDILIKILSSILMIIIWKITKTP